MSEEASTSQKTPDYHKEYPRRFRAAQTKAHSKGWYYEYPNRASVGWKIHLNVPPDPHNPITQKIAKLTQERRFAYKIGRSDQEGKGITIYIGDKDTTDAFAEELNQTVGADLPSPSGEILTDDIPLCGNVWGRFEATHLQTKYGPLHQYGSKGIPYLKHDMGNLSGLETSTAFASTPEEARKRADRALREHFGVFYTGTPKPTSGK